MAQATYDNKSLLVLRGFVAMSANSLWLMVLQLGYAAITSRLLTPDAFGSYAVALAAVGLTGMVGGSSLELAAARRSEESAHLDRALMAAAGIVGTAALVITVLVSEPWAVLWHSPGSAPVTKVLALSLPFAALQGVFAGILRRKGFSASLAVTTAIMQSLALAVGLAAVLIIEDAWTLAVSPVAASAFAALALALRMPGGWRQPALPGSASIPDLTFSVKAAALNLMRYASRSFGVWSIGRFAGTDALGAFNRAATLTTVPLDSIQRSFTYALYPEMRSGGPVHRSPTALNDVLLLVAASAVLLAGTGFFLAPVLVNVLLGPGWEQAALLAGPAVLLGVVPMVSAPLGTALEAQGRFRPTVISWAVSVPAIGLGALLTYELTSPLPAVIGLVIAGLISIPVLSVPLWRQGLLDPANVLLGLRSLLVIQAVFSTLLFAVHTAVGNALVGALVMGLVVAVEAALLWLGRERVPAFTVLRSRLG